MMKLAAILSLLALTLTAGCADHYWKGRAYEEKIKALALTHDGKVIPSCFDSPQAKECAIR